jgi:hypothetical protein
MEIKLTITISDIKSWGTNWDNEAERKEALAQFRYDVRQGIMRAGGIPSNDIEIESELIK